ncbi:MAG: glutamate--cysteine ligase [Rickettsiales endosymbiont of Dermacentor nuttalli]
MQVIDILDNLLQTHHNVIKEWFEQLQDNQMTCFYTSVDLRYSGYKLTPVDTNLFPAGFNNISDQAKKHASRLADNFLSTHFQNVNKIIIVAENYSRNLYYLDNLVALKHMLENTNRVVEIATIGGDNVKLESASKGEVTFYTVKKNDLGYLATNKGFIPDIIILNNDLTNGVPSVLKEIKQPIVPSVHLGWHNRRKSIYFNYYNKILQSFCNAFNIDSFLLQALFTTCKNLDFKHKEGLEVLAEQANILLSQLKEKYKIYNIKDEPYLFIKADKGTYGRGIMVAKSVDEILYMNKKHRNSMHVIKDGIHNKEVILQEGIRTIENINGKFAEPLIYLVNNTPIECIYRVNRDHDEFNSLNSTGMYFINNYKSKHVSVLYLVAQLANLAAIYEANINNVFSIK